MYLTLPVLLHNFIKIFCGAKDVRQPVRPQKCYLVTNVRIGGTLTFFDKFIGF